MSNDYIILKRAGNEARYDVTKMRKVINWASKGLAINPIELESNAHIMLKNNITTREIQQSLILGALRLTSLEKPDWKYAAGRLKLFDIYKEISICRGNHKKIENIYNNYPKYLYKSIKNKIYTKTILEKYSQQEIEIAATYINQKYDLEYDYAGINLLAQRYLCEYNDSLWELPQEMFLTIALLVEQNAPTNNRLALVKDTYEKLARRKISLATPLLMNLRRPQGNLSSCFITAMDDNLKSIFYTIDQIAAISKHGGGVGCNISRVRCKGARLKGIKNASGGVIPWIRIVNDTAVAVNQQGKRKGAVTVSLDMWHMDIEDFLELQTENGDQRMKAYDIFPQVVIPDCFMKAVLSNTDWLLVDPHEIRQKYNVELSELWGKTFDSFYKKIEQDALNQQLEIYKFVNAKNIFKKIMKSQVETGMPYIAFKDALNRANPNKHDGVILGTNLCTESHSNIKPSIIHDTYFDNGTIKQEISNGLVHVCNLVSVNLATVDIEKELESVCKTSVRILDNAIDITSVPIAEGYLHNKRYRTIGVGAMGLADYLAKNSIAYEHSADQVDKLFEKFALYSIEESINLAKQKGTFQAYKGSDWDRGIILSKNRTWFLNNSQLPERWNSVFDNLKKFGIRNSQITAIAPNTSSSLMQGCTASILPVYSRFFIDTHANGSIPNCPPFIKEKLWYYQENKHIDQKKIVEIVATINKWIDTGISMELVYNLNRNITAKEIFETLIQAWQKNIKTIYYTRSIQKDGAVSGKNECSSCAG
ncbi:ribonucleoside-diphosphate reductase subunit alpha [bacterium]|nr:ribonucleoside-diphosphate reductase subunit alpha [bacterium]